MRLKADEENFDEALAQAYQVWGETQVSRLNRMVDPADGQISQELQLLLNDEGVTNISKEVKHRHWLELTSSPKMFKSCWPPFEGTSEITKSHQLLLPFPTCTRRLPRTLRSRDCIEHNFSKTCKSTGCNFRLS